MGQTRSDLSHSAAAPGGVKWKSNATPRRLSISRFRSSRRKSRSEQLSSRNPMRNKVLSCLGRRKRHSSHTEEDPGCGAEADPTARRGHRAGKLPRDEASEEDPETLHGLSGDVEAAQLTVNREAGSVRCEEPRPGDNASVPPAGAMEEQPAGGDRQSCLNPPLTSDPDAHRTVHVSASLSMKENMTKPEPTSGDQNNGIPDQADPSSQSPQRRGFPGTIPKLIITRDPSPGRGHDPDPPSSCLDPNPADEESPCSDSGCGGSPALMRSPRKLSTSSSIGLSSASSFEESEDDFTGSDMESSLSPTRSLCSPGDGPANKSWNKLKSMVHWSPLAFTLKSRQPWVQLAGHAGNFQAKDGGRLLKRYSECEQQCLKELMTDILRPYVPGYYGVVTKDDQEFNLMDDLLDNFESPSIMDCKMGSRTYLEDELMKAREKPRLRKDMYEKMICVDPEAPTEEERAQQGVLKPRYMQWRETLSSTATLGFRIEGIKTADGFCSTSFKKTKLREHVMKIFEDFVDGNVQILKNYLQRLKELRSALEQSYFFASHEVVGSSLLFVHDASGKASVWMIDFGKTVPLPPPMFLDHRTPWEEGNREDGYLWGMDNLIDIFSCMLRRAPRDGDKTSEKA